MNAEDLTRTIAEESLALFRTPLSFETEIGLVMPGLAPGIHEFFLASVKA